MSNQTWRAGKSPKSMEVYSWEMASGKPCLALTRRVRDLPLTYDFNKVAIWPTLCLSRKSKNFYRLVNIPRGYQKIPMMVLGTQIMNAETTDANIQPNSSMFKLFSPASVWRLHLLSHQRFACELSASRTLKKHVLFYL